MEPVIGNTNNLPIEKIKLLFALLLAFSVNFFSIDNNNKSLPFTLLNNDTLSVKQLIKIYHIPNTYNIVAQYIAFSAVAQNKICKLLSYNKIIQSPKIHLWK